MANGRLFDFDPETRTVEYFHWDEHSETFTIERRQDVEYIADFAKARFNEFSGPRDKWGNGKGDMPNYQHVGYIPDVFMNKMMQDGSINDPKAVAKFFRDNPAFKTRPGEAW